MVKRRHTSARGEQIDFDLLHHHNKDMIAIGNANMNANGDILGKGGKIVRRVEDIPLENMADPNAAYNEANPKSTKMVSLKGKLDDLPEPTPSIQTDEEDVGGIEAPLDEVKIENGKVTPTKTEEKSKIKRKIVDSED